jgi:hypothetical protein
MVDSPIISLCFPSGLKPLASGLPQTQRASIRRQAQGLGRESSQRFWTFGPERGLGPGQGRQRSVHAAVGSEDPRKIDSTWHIPPGWKKCKLTTNQLTRVMYAVGKKLGSGLRGGTVGIFKRVAADVPSVVVYRKPLRVNHLD